MKSWSYKISSLTHCIILKFHKYPSSSTYKTSFKFQSNPTILNINFGGFETLQDLMTKHLIQYCNGPRVKSNKLYNFRATELFSRKAHSPLNQTYYQSPLCRGHYLSTWGQAKVITSIFTLTKSNDISISSTFPRKMWRSSAAPIVK